MKKVAVVGYGSIGQRHVENFKLAGAEVAVVSRRNHQSVNALYSNIQDCLKQFKPDIVIVCQETYLHASAVRILMAESFAGLILVEKPLFDLTETNFKDFKGLNIRVMYNLRFNPLLIALKKELTNENVLSAHIYVGQNLRSWRPNRDYRHSYSARSAEGGGVLLDLSHEIDYAHWLFGSFRELVAHVDQISDLEISSSDHCSILLRGHRVSAVNIEMNYIDHSTQRFIIVNTQKNTYSVDLVQKTFKINNVQKVIESSKEESYKLMVENILHHEAEGLTGFDEAVAVLHMARTALISNQEKRWCDL
jgi:predicted dehydrogenase